MNNKTIVDKNSLQIKKDTKKAQVFTFSVLNPVTLMLDTITVETNFLDDFDNFSKEQPTQKQLNSCVEIYKWIKKMYPRVYKAVNHKDLFPTACPCYPLAEYVNQHRS